MKSNTKNTHFKIKCLFFSCMLLVSLSSIAQKRSVILDPNLGKIEMADLTGAQVNENYIQPMQPIKLKLPIGVVTHGKAMPAGSCKIKIGFGSKLVLDPSFDLNTVALSNYFKWTSATNGGETQVTGELIAALPVNYETVDVAFKVNGTVEGRSTITANFLISNHNTTTILSDEDGTNNMAFLPYSVTTKSAPVPVTTINDLAKTDCSINVNFATDKEVNLSSYEVEASKDGISYLKVAEIAATNLSFYNINFLIAKELQANVLYVRIKTIDRNGRAVYSVAKTVNGTCNGNWKLDIYPNPASSVKSVMIRAVEGVFNDKYMVSMIDMSGKLVQKNERQLINVPGFKLDLGNIAAGKYLIKVVNSDGSQTALLKFEKL